MLARDKCAISTSISALIVIALITIIGLSVYFNDTFNSTSTTYKASDSPSTGSSQDITSNSGLYLLSFNQTAMCGPNTGLYGSYFIPWSVTLTASSYRETTKAQPPGSTGTPNGFTSTKDASYSSISFSVPDGTYSYTLNPTNDFENSQTGASSGTITINGNNVTVYVHFNLASCGSTITTTTESSTSTPNQSLIALDLSNGSAACQSIRGGQMFLASWSGNVCTLTASYTVSSFALKPDVTLEIFPGVTVVMNGGGFANYGTIINNGTMELQTSFISYGIMVNSGLISTNSPMSTESDDSSISNGGTFDNYGTFLINGHVGYYQQTKTYVNGTTTYTEYTSGEENLTGGDFGNGGVLDNYGTINNTGYLWNTQGFNSTVNNYGTIRNLENAKFVNGYTMNNNGIIVNSGDFTNNGRIVDYCSSNFVQEATGTYSGNSLIGACGTA